MRGSGSFGGMYWWGLRLSLSWRLLAGGRQETGDGSIPLPDVCEFQTGLRAARSPPPTAGCLGARLLTQRQQLLTFHGAGQGVTCGAHGAGCGLPFSGAMSTGQHRVTCLCLWVGPGELGHAGLTQGVITDVYAAFSLPAVPSWTPESAQEALLNQVSLVFFHLPGLGRWMKEAARLFRSTHPSGQPPARLISST
ncbi:hypothetical protein R6Z07F_014031 [Ovis aries]